MPYDTLSKYFDGTTPQLIKYLFDNSVNIPRLRRDIRNVYGKLIFTTISNHITYQSFQPIFCKH